MGRNLIFSVALILVARHLAYAGGFCQARLDGQSQVFVTIVPGDQVVVNSSIRNTDSFAWTYSWRVRITSQITPDSPIVISTPTDGSRLLLPGEEYQFPITMNVPNETPAGEPGVTVQLFVLLERNGGELYTCTAHALVDVIPAGETTASAGWAGDSPDFFRCGDPPEPCRTVHKWRQTLLPATANFRGRLVREQDGGGGPDTCWFEDSEITQPFEAVTGGEWGVRPGNVWGDDFVGWFPRAVRIYRAEGRAPCGTTLTQDMAINATAQRFVIYTTNELTAGIGVNTVSSGRAGQMATRTWP